MIGQSIARYRIVEHLGDGGMASVWKAEDPLLGRMVALKLLAPALAASAEARRRFRREAELAQMLDHPAIARVLDSGEADQGPWIAMSLLTGETLAARMRRGLLPVPEIREVAAAVASALGYAHSRGILHRDISANNIMLVENDRTFLLDFGLATVEGASLLTRTGTMQGTLVYMAPELLCGQPADPRSDVYSLCAVLYEMLTGTTAHRGETIEGLIYAKLNMPVRPALLLRPELPPQLAAVAERGLAREPGDRFGGAQELLMALGAEPLETSSASPRVSGAAAEEIVIGNAVGYLGVPRFESPGASDPELEKLASELADGVRRRLGTPGRMHIVPADDPLPREADLRGWARQHGANLLLVGRVRRNSALVRVECTLRDPENGAALAGHMVEGSPFDPLGLEDRLVSELHDSLPTAGTHLDRETRPVSRTQDAAERLVQARAYLQRHDHEPSVDAALGLLEWLAGLPMPSAETLATLARAYLDKHRLTHQHAWIQRAANVVERVIRIAPGLPAAMFAHADLKAQTGHGAEAVELYERALAEAPEEFEGWWGLSRLHDQLRQFEQAEDCCRRAIALRPRDWRGYSMLGMVYFRQGRFALALAPWRRVTRLVPDHARAASNIGALYFQLDRFEESEAAFRRSLELEPTASSYANLGTLLFSLHRFQESADLFERATLLRPADARFWGYLGAAADQLPGQQERARQAWQRAIGLMRELLQRNPEDAESWAILSGWLVRQESPEAGRVAIERALSLAPGDRRCVMEAAHTYTLLGESERALDHLEAALREGHGLREVERSLTLQPLTKTERFRRMVDEMRDRRTAS